MRESVKQPRILLAFAGVLALLATLALGAATMRPTEATWQDTVHGESVFGAANPYENNRFARAISTYGFMDRAVRDSNVGAVTAFRQTPDTSIQTVGPASSNSVGYFPTNLLPLDTVGFSCATLDTRSQCANGNPAGLSNPTANAVSETRSLEVRTSSILGSDLVTYQGANPIRATAACSPTEGVATLSSGGPIVLGRNGIFEQEVRVAIPGANAETTGFRSWGSYDYTATLQHVRKQSAGYAMSQLRLRVNATGTGGAERWNLTLILAHAECGVDRETTAAPSRPTTGEWPALAGQTSRMATFRVDQPAALQPIVEPTEEGTDGSGVAVIEEVGDGELAEEDNSDLPSLPVEGDHSNDPDAPVAQTTVAVTTTPKTPSSETSMPSGQSAATTTDQAPATTSTPVSVPAEVATPATTEQTAMAEGPQEPESVRVGREFAVVNRDGVELGTAKVEDIVRTPGCGVELTLSITTSAEAGADRWASVAPDDFAEVRAGGSTREVGRASSDCAQAANSRTTALSPGRDYELVIAIQLEDSAQRAMLQPDGTAGWIFDLPPLPRVEATTSPATAPATTAAEPEASAAAEVSPTAETAGA